MRNFVIPWLFYIPPKVSPKYYPDSNNPWAYAWLGFNGSIADDFLKCCNLSIDNPIFVDNKLQLRQLFSTLVEEHKKTNQCDLNCLGITYQIVHKMVSMNNENPSFTIKEKHVFEAQEFIKNNYQFDITIKDIASSCAITTNYLSNIFNEVCGLTTKQYLINIRLEKASTLLQEKKTKIKEISKLVGYKNQLHFSSEFKKRFGISPKQYINKCYKKED